MYKYRHQKSIQLWLILSPLSWYQLPLDPTLPRLPLPFLAAAAMALSPVHSDTSSSDDEAPLVPAAASTLQTINIRNHVPVVLDLDQSNYGQWRCLFDSVFGKFGLLDAHIRAPPPVAQRDTDWRMSDCCIVNWLHTTIAKPVFDIIYKPHATAFTVWGDIEGIFRNNELQRATYYEAEFRSLQQGDLSITDYTMRLKQLADSLRDVGYPVSEPSQVLNLLRGLNPKSAMSSR
jgi:hypothetical protein